MTAMGESDVGVRNFEASAIDLVWRSHSHFGVGRDRRSVWLTGSQSPSCGSSVACKTKVSTTPLQPTIKGLLRFVAPKQTM
jgi:hypothetical protein